MSYIKKVIRVELRETIREHVVKHKRREYARGWFRISEVINRETVAQPMALLECGHWRNGNGYPWPLDKAKRLGCWECERAERDAEITEATGAKP